MTGTSAALRTARGGAQAWRASPDLRDGGEPGGLVVSEPPTGLEMKRAARTLRLSVG